MSSQYISLFNGIAVNIPIEYKDVYIYQISEVLLAANAVIPDHIQKCDEISYIISGEAIFYNDDKPQKVKAGDIHLIGKDEKHKIVVEKDSNFRYVCIGLEISSASASYKVLDNIFHSGSITKIKAVDEIRTLVSLLMNELYTKSLFHEDMVEMLVMQILTLIYRKIVLGINLDLKSADTPSSNAIYEIMRFIDSNLLTINNVEEIADELSYSKYYISHVFKEKTGLTVLNYITKRKIDIAVDLLKSNKLKMSEIAEKLNYESTQSFSKMFKKHIGMSPLKFKKSAMKFIWRNTAILDTKYSNNVSWKIYIFIV